MNAPIRMSAKEFREGGAKAGKPNKYRNEPVVIDGIRFHSKVEGAFYAELKLLEKSGLIRNLELQPKFILNGLDGSQIGVYRADFRFFDVAQNRTRIVDVKGVETTQFRRTVKLIRAQYGIEIEVVRRG